MLVGVPGDATYANYREARLALWEDTILPLLDGVADRLNHWLAPRFGVGLRLAYDADSLSALAPRREAVWARVQGADFLTQDEKRAAVGYGPLKGGDLPSRKYSEDQPRAPACAAAAASARRRPAGSPGAGQWVDGGGGGGDGGNGDAAGPVPKEPPTEWATESVKRNWTPWNGEVAKLPDGNDQERRCYSDIFAVEGGTKDDIQKDKFGNEYVAASSGISKELLERLKQRNVFPDLADAKHPGELTIEQRVRIYRWYVDTQALHQAGNGVPGHRLLAEIKDHDSASALCDVLFRGGGTGGATLVRDAVNDTIKELPADEITRLNLDRLTNKGVLKPKDFQAYKAITNGGHGQLLREKLSDRRQVEWPRERRRNDYFRFRPKGN
jgi:Phage portal protein